MFGKGTVVAFVHWPCRDVSSCMHLVPWGDLKIIMSGREVPIAVLVCLCSGCSAFVFVFLSLLFISSCFGSIQTKNGRASRRR